MFIPGNAVKLDDSEREALALDVADTVTSQMESDISLIHGSAELIDTLNNDVTNLKSMSEECFAISEYPNLIDTDTATWLDGSLLNNLGWYETRAGYTTLNYPIPIEPGKTYTFNKYIDKVVIKKYNSIQDYTPCIAYKTLQAYKYTVPAEYTDAKYMFVSLHSENSNFEPYRNIKVEEGDICHSVEKEISVRNEIAIPGVLKSNLYGKKIMTLGDSLTADGLWQKNILSALGISSYTNLAVGGAAVNVFADNVTAENIADIDIVIVMGLFNSTSSLPGTVNDEASNSSSASICAGYKYIVDKLLTLKPTVKIVLMSPHRPRANDVAEKAAAVGEVAKYYGLPFIDLYNTAGFNGYTYDTYLRDNVHSSDAGYKRESEVIAGGLIHYFG